MSDALRFLRTPLLACLFWCMFSQNLRASEFGLGLAAVEEGDDRIRPAVFAHGGLFDNWYTDFYYYGRKYGPIIERTMILTASYKLDIFKIFGAKFMHGAAGLAAMNEQTELKFPGDSENSSTEDYYNFGGKLGFYADAPIPGPIYIRGSFESCIFFAGPNGAIFISTGRKTFLSLSTGVKF